MVSDLWVNGQWDFSKISLLIPEDLQQTIRSQAMNFEGSSKDIRIWGITSNGIFSTCSAYHYIRNLNFDNNHEDTCYGFKDIWKAKIPNKIKTFLWLLLHGKTPTNSSLHSKGFNIPASCKICNHQWEDITHIFFQCSYATKFWDSVKRNCTSPILRDISDLTNRSCFAFWQSNKNEALNSWVTWGTFLPFCLWNIWLTRNSNVFNDKTDVTSFS